MLLCTNCKSNEEDVQMWTCDTCRKGMCQNCIKLTASEIKCMDLKKNRTLKLFCEACQNKNEVLGMIVELKQVILSQSNRIDDLNGKVETLTLKLIQSTDVGQSQGKAIDNVISDIKIIKEISSKPTFADALAKNKNDNKKEPVIVVKPNDTHNGGNTMEEIKKKIDPSKIGVKIDNIKKIKNGGVAITCPNDKSRETLVQNVEKELGKNFTVATMELKNPRIIITSVEEKFLETEETNLIQTLIDQNELNEEEKKGIRVIRRYKMKSAKHLANIVLEISPILYKRVMASTHVYIGFKSCKVYEYHNIIVCYK